MGSREGRSSARPGREKGCCRNIRPHRSLALLPVGERDLPLPMGRNGPPDGPPDRKLPPWVGFRSTRRCRENVFPESDPAGRKSPLRFRRSPEKPTDGSSRLPAPYQGKCALLFPRACDNQTGSLSGRSADWLAHLPWEQGVGGSNPLAPTNSITKQPAYGAPIPGRYTVAGGSYVRLEFERSIDAISMFFFFSATRDFRSHQAARSTPGIAGPCKSRGIQPWTRPKK